MPKATYVSDTVQYGTSQLLIGGISTYNIRPLTIDKSPSDSIGTVATLQNTGNVDLVVDIVITHEHTDGIHFFGGGSALNVSITVLDGLYNFDSGPVQLDTSLQTGMWNTRIEIFDAGTTTPIPTIGDTLIIDAWNLSIITEVSITNFSVY